MVDGGSVGRVCFMGEVRERRVGGGESVKGGGRERRKGAHLVAREHRERVVSDHEQPTGKGGSRDQDAEHRAGERMRMWRMKSRKKDRVWVRDMREVGSGK